MKWQRSMGLLLAGLGILALSYWYSHRFAEPEPTATAVGKQPATNAVSIAKKGGGTNAAKPLVPKGRPMAGATNTVATAASKATNAPVSLLDRAKALTQHKAFYPTLTIAPLALGLVFLALSFRSKGAKALALTPSPLTPTRVKARSSRKNPVQTCNILQVTPESSHVWQFTPRNGAFALQRQQTSTALAPLPSALVSKDWRTLFQRKLNVACISPDHVFLRVAHLPASTFEETVSMVEFQLEKLSPLAVAQTVWSLQVVPHSKGNLQTVIVLILARSIVEEFLGRLEGQGYLADRLELPLLDQLLATQRRGDGAWVYPLSSTSRTAVVAWWYGDTLQNLDLVTLPETNPHGSLSEQLMQMAWAGEMEGWLTSPPSWHLVGEPESVSRWEPVLRQAFDQPIEVISALSPPELASLTAERAAHADEAANLLPVEFTTRYQQQFVDRLWMRGLGAVIAVYLIGVAIYLVALQFALYRTRSVENEVARLGPAYTNALQLKAQSEVLKDRQELKFAALDCWKQLADLLPTAATLEGMNFSDGHRLTLNGTAPAGNVKELLEFEAGIRKATAHGQPMFDLKNSDNLTYRANPNPATVSWNLTMELKRAEVQ